MSRYISKLPPEIRELAEKRRSEQNPKSKKDDLFLIATFDWEKTLEGFDFWENIKDENYSVFYEKYPQKDKLDVLIDFIENLNEFERGLFTTFEEVLNKAKEIRDGK